ncbi:MAG TPA: HAD family hydrolase [Candidatus Dormibacteraeota bacterium]
MTARWLTFDCFGTLVDWRHGIGTTAELLFPGRGAELLDAYNRAEPALEVEAPFRRYREVLTEGLRRAAAELSLPLNEDDAPALAATIPFWPVFGDVAEALAACRADGWRLALLTNCDRDLIALTRRRLPVPFDAAVTAEDVGAYKPDHAHFRRFEAAFDVSRDRWVHVAQSHFHDIRPAHALGIRRIWVNRLGEAHDPSLADAVLPDLSTLPSAVRRLAQAAPA